RPPCAVPFVHHKQEPRFSGSNQASRVKKPFLSCAALHRPGRFLCSPRKMGKDGGGDGLEVPLLKRTYYHGNCPGCRLEKRNETRRGVPYTEFACMWLVTVCS
uniref:Uncharacterized protein n=1 Tax=Aegilops tauschii subsp. strangulata TaxID=200361 RepID=A0A453EPQ2_AEGTS